ncbi:MAG: hypothetical protein RID07_06725, partial [Lacipirellulaceae bacterium]
MKLLGSKSRQLLEIALTKSRCEKRIAYAALLTLGTAFSCCQVVAAGEAEFVKASSASQNSILLVNAPVAT